MEAKEWLFNNTETSIGFDTFWFGEWENYVGMMMDILEGSSISSTLDANKLNKNS